jgi:hypothetical protein
VAARRAAARTAKPQQWQGAIGNPIALFLPVTHNCGNGFRLGLSYNRDHDRRPKTITARVASHQTSSTLRVLSVSPTAQRNTRWSSAGAGWTLYCLRPCAEMFGREIVLPYGAAVLRRTQEREQARKLLAFLATSAAREQFLASGVE